MWYVHIKGDKMPIDFWWKEYAERWAEKNLKPDRYVIYENSAPVPPSQQHKQT